LLISLATRYWGAAVGGLLAGLPSTAAPITLLLALEYGEDFAIESAYSTILGVIALSSFCFIYSWCAIKYSWAISLTFSMAVYFFLAFGVSNISTNVITACLIVSIVLFLLRSNLPKADISDQNTTVSSKEIIARMIASAILVVSVTGLATFFGPSLSGVFATFPTAAAILAVFTHKFYSANQVAILMKGLMLGSFSLILFYLSLIYLSSNFNFYISFVISLVIILIIQFLRVMISNQRKI
jgi:hypothetical protein